MSVIVGGMALLALAAGLVVVVAAILGVVWIVLWRRDKHD